MDIDNTSPLTLHRYPTQFERAERRTPASAGSLLFLGLTFLGLALVGFQILFGA